jgi:hypothetical protein
MLLTSEQRLEKYKDFKTEGEIVCKACKKTFVNLYAFSSHCYNRILKRFIDNEHEAYFKQNLEERKYERRKIFINKKRKKICIKCKKEFFVDFEQCKKRKCPECHIKFPNKKRLGHKVEGFKTIKCLRCGSDTIAKKCASHIICKKCNDKERQIFCDLRLNQPIKAKCKYCKKEVLFETKERTLRYRAANVVCEDCKNNYKKHPKYDLVLKLLSETDLTKGDIEKLISLKKDFITKVAIEHFGQIWWQERLKRITNNASQITSKKRKLFFNELRKDPVALEKYLSYLHRMPSKLELLFSSNLPKEFDTESNVWTTLKIDSRFEHHEIDLKVKLDNYKKFIIFIDGEAFHGENAFFKTVSPVADEKIAKAFADLGYYVIRYSETEVKSNWAVKNFCNLFSDFKNHKPQYYYRNWQTKQEIKLY